jgi:H+/gluconate symporter-like permease
MMMALSLQFTSPLVDFFGTHRVIHALVVVAYLLFFSIAFLFLAIVIVHRYRASAMKHRR